MPRNYDGLPADLEEPPSGTYPPPVETAAQHLPFDQIGWSDFEKLCGRLIRLDGSVRKSRRYGVPGQSQGGIDIYSALGAGRYASYQCKQWETFKPSDVANAVDAFLDGPWREKTDKFVLCVSVSFANTKLSDAVEAQRARLEALQPPIAFEPWDADELVEKLKGKRELVKDIFGPVWATRFCGAADPQSAEPASPLESIHTHTVRVPLISIDWAQGRLRTKLKELQAQDPDTFLRANDQIGSPPRPELVRVAALTPPGWLDQAGPLTWEVMALASQAHAEWQAAVVSWEHAADRTTSTSEQAKALAAGARAAECGGDAGQYQTLLARARSIDPDDPRVVLAGLPDETSAEKELEILTALKTEDPDDMAAIAARETFAHIRKKDFAAARVSLEQVEQIAPASVMAEGSAISLIVNEEELSLFEHRALKVAELGTANTQAEALRERLSGEHRWSESTGILGYMAQIAALFGEREKASKILRSARPQERQTTEQKALLASSAVARAQDYMLGRELLEGAENIPAVARLRVEIAGEIGTPPERQAALSELDRIISEGGGDATEAAATRLFISLGSHPTPWSEEAEIFLKRNGFESLAVAVHAVYLAGHEGYEAGERLLRPYGNALWAATTRLRVAMAPNAPRSASLDAARKLLSLGPPQPVRVEAAQGLARGGDFPGAREHLLAVARDPGGSPGPRTEAYETLMQVVGNEQADWIFARELYEEWNALAPGDQRAPKWGPRVLKRRNK